MQLSYGRNMSKGFAGMKASSALDIVETMIADEAIPLGFGVMKKYGVDASCRLPKSNKCVITDDAGTYTAGSIVVTVNGTTITQAYSSTKDGTLTALAAAIQAGVANVYSCAYVAGSHTITLLTRNTDLVVVPDVSGITGTMTISSTTVTSQDAASAFRGLAIHDHAREQSAAGVVQFEATEAVNVMREGEVYVTVDEAVTPDDTVYLRLVTDGVKLRGMLCKTNTAGSTIAVPGVRFMESGDALSIVRVAINLPQ